MLSRLHDVLHVRLEREDRAAALGRGKERLERVVEQAPGLLAGVQRRVRPVAVGAEGAGLSGDGIRPEQRRDLETALHVRDVHRAHAGIGRDQVAVAAERGNGDRGRVENGSSLRGPRRVFEALLEERSVELRQLEPQGRERLRELLPLPSSKIARERAEPRPRRGALEALEHGSREA